MQTPVRLVRDGYDTLLKLLTGVEEFWSLPSSRSRQLAFGIAGVLVTMIIVIASSVLAVRPVGTTMYTADFPEAGMIRAGDDVRVAGISVGSVQKVALAGDHVSVGLRIKKSVHIGDQSRICLLYTSYKH